MAAYPANCYADWKLSVHTACFIGSVWKRSLCIKYTLFSPQHHTSLAKNSFAEGRMRKNFEVLICWNINTSSWVGGCLWEWPINIFHLHLAICLQRRTVAEITGDELDGTQNMNAHLCFNKKSPRHELDAIKMTVAGRRQSEHIVLLITYSCCRRFLTVKLTC